MRRNQISSYENLQESVRELDLGVIDTVRYVYNDKDTVITIKTDEFTSICPKTSLPDFAKLTIYYRPDKLLIELKSLKFYLHKYRNLGIFQENAISKILEDLVKSASPNFMMVVGEFNPRGGLSTRIVSRYYKDRESFED
ncbi:MAG: preQ(1) synthase [Candidatus Thermoplasmatota archaeon]|jgi:7-cyano-7-deazaguanine reductase|nr:preQ(1) synthase [Candidatus Thermoplasmatota archaeon]